MELYLTPNQRFAVEGSEKQAQMLADSFRRSRAEGLVELVKKPVLATSSRTLGYWHDYAAIFMRTLCAFSDTDPLHLPVDEPSLATHAAAIPPLKGAEYVSKELLAELWRELDSLVHKMLLEQSISARAFIAQTFPEWGAVGKIHFHLAENKSADAAPFVFLATYSVRVAGKARVQHRPLGVALQESAKAGNAGHLKQLLEPIYEASKTSSFIQYALQQQTIYTPFYLNPAQAFSFIQEIPQCEQAGIVCKVPAWWRNSRPPRAKVAIKLGTKKTSQLGFSQLLDFDVGVSVGGKTLSQAQLKKILEAEGALVTLGGKWIEVDKTQIERMLGVWNEAVATAYSEGISFSKAMRMMAGFSRGEDLSNGCDEQQVARDWLEVVAGPSFSTLLAQLRSPKGSFSKEVADVLKRHLNASLRPYQKSGLAWLHSISSLGLGGCLADDMGLGKTIQVLALLLIHKHQLQVKQPSLLVLPASLIGNWQAEICKFAPGLRYEILHNSAMAAKNLHRPPKNLTQLDFLITTYGMAVKTAWLQQIDWHAVIADEAQAIKNAKTKQSKALRSLKANTKIAMTGTPVENSLGDLWSIFDFSCPGLLGSEPLFKQAIATISDKNDKDKTGYSALRQLIAPYILRRKKTDRSVISDLPDKIELTSECYLTKKQAELYQKEVMHLKDSLEDASGIQRKGLVLSSLLKFKQICNHPSQYLANDSYLPAHSGKFSKLKELVETMSARQEKVLLFTQFRELTDILTHYLGQCFGREGLVIHGGTAVKQRQRLVNEFQDPAGPPFFVLSLKAGGTGLNLTEASHVIHFDRWWNPAVENQASDRAFRIGQKNNVLVHKFVCKGTIEEKIDAMISDKRELADAVVEGTKEVNFTELSDDELISLVSLDVHALAAGSDG